MSQYIHRCQMHQDGDPRTPICGKEAFYICVSCGNWFCDEHYFAPQEMCTAHVFWIDAPQQQEKTPDNKTTPEP